MAEAAAFDFAPVIGRVPLPPAGGGGDASGFDFAPVFGSQPVINAPRIPLVAPEPAPEPPAPIEKPYTDADGKSRTMAFNPTHNFWADKETGESLVPETRAGKLLGPVAHTYDSGTTFTQNGKETQLDPTKHVIVGDKVHERSDIMRPWTLWDSTIGKMVSEPVNVATAVGAAMQRGEGPEQNIPLVAHAGLTATGLGNIAPRVGGDAATAALATARQAVREAAAGPPPVTAPASAVGAPAAPVMATERPGMGGIRLLPPEAPHAPAPAEEAAAAGAVPPVAPPAPTGNVVPFPPRASLSAASAVNPLAEVSPETIGKLKGILADEGFNEHTLEQRLDEMSQHEFLGEVSPAMKAHMAAVQSAGGPAKNEIVLSVQQRANEAADRMRASFDQAFGANENRAQLQRIMTVERDQAAKPFWDKFRATPVPPTPELTALMPRLEASGALRAANRAMAEEGLPATQTFTRGGAETSAPTAAAFQYAKEHLDDLIEKSLAQNSAGGARRYGELKNALVSAIDNHPDPNVAGVWKQARDVYARPTQIIQAMKMGGRALDANVSREELPFITASYSPAEMRAFNIGLRGRLEDMLGKPGRAESSTINTVLAGNNQDKIRWAIGDQKANRLIGAVEHEQRMSGAKNELIGGSQTQPRIEAAKSWTPQPSNAESLARLAMEPHKIPGAIAEAGLKAIGRAAEGKEAERLANLRNEAARIFTAQGPERDAILRQLVLGDQRLPLMAAE